MASQNKSSKVTRGDSFQQKKGDLYQFVYAVKICLEAKEGERIQIEHRGDISSDQLYSYEIKKYESNFTLQTNQFWNTLYNWVIDKEIYKEFHNLILLTTSDSNDIDSIKAWNESSKEEKILTVQNLETTIRKRKNVSEDKIKFLNYVLSFNNKYTKEDLMTILDKIKIVIKAKPSKEINDELLNLECFKFDTNADKKLMINASKSFVLDTGLEKDNWVIETTELHNALKQLKSGRKHILKKIDQIDDLRFSDYSEYPFVKEIKKIKIENENIDEAITNYYIASEQIQEIIQEYPNLSIYTDSLKKFSINLLRNLNAIKNEHRYVYSLDKEKMNYFKSLQIELKNIEYIENDDSFQIGNIHKIVDEGKHNWLMNENK